MKLGIEFGIYIIISAAPIAMLFIAFVVLPSHQLNVEVIFPFNLNEAH